MGYLGGQHVVDLLGRAVGLGWGRTLLAWRTNLDRRHSVDFGALLAAHSLLERHVVLLVIVVHVLGSRARHAAEGLVLLLGRQLWNAVAGRGTHVGHDGRAERR